jgi:hypothetical protein
MEFETGMLGLAVLLIVYKRPSPFLPNLRFGKEI